MGYALKTSGLATDATMVLAVEDDGTTVKDFASSSVTADMTVHANVVVSSSTWKGVSRGYFETKPNGAGEFYGIIFGTNKPPLSLGTTDEGSIFIACAGMDTRGGDGTLIGIPSRIWGRDGSSKFAHWGGYATTTSMPSDLSTKFSVGMGLDMNATWNAYYGLESGSSAADGNGTETGATNTTSLSAIGGYSGNGNCPGKYHVIALFGRKLTATEFGDLHNDWFGQLLELPATSILPSYYMPQSYIKTL